MNRRHARARATSPAPRRRRLVVVVLAPLLVLVPMSAWASGHMKQPATSTRAAATTTGAHAAATTAATSVTAKTSWSRSWSPPLALLLVGTTKVGFQTLPYSMHAGAGQKAIATARFRTAWVDVRALKDGPNIVQQGLSIQPAQFKLQIMHGSTPASHRANCHIAGTTGHVLAFGPRIDVADGRWHTVTCIKYADTARGTKVVVIVDGVAGAPKWSRTPIGAVLPTGAIRLGGRSARASSDSLDGWISSASFSAR